MTSCRYEDVYKTLGANNIGRTTQLLIDQIMVNIESPELRKVISFGVVEIYIYDIPENAACLGKTLCDVVIQKGFPRSCTITCIFVDATNSFIIPRGDHTFTARDRVFLCGLRKDIKQAVKFLG